MDRSTEDHKNSLKAKFRSPFQRVDRCKEAGPGNASSLAAPKQKKSDEQAHIEQCATSAHPAALRLHVQNTPKDVVEARKPMGTTTGFTLKPFKAPAKIQQSAVGKENKRTGASVSLTSAPARKDETVAANASYYTCLFSARSSKKKKPSLQDGVLQVLDTKCCLYSHDGRAQRTLLFFQKIMFHSLILSSQFSQGCCCCSHVSSCSSRCMHCRKSLPHLENQ